MEFIVGVGASAGGVEAIIEMVSAIPKDSGLSFVVVQHLAPDHPSLMEKILSTHTDLEVRTITDGAGPEANVIHVMPSGPGLRIEDGVFHLVPRETSSTVRLPIDDFFVSLAEDRGDRAVCVVLSGTGRDGTTGLRAIKSAGGITCVQKGTTAQFRGMPDSAMATGLVDFVLAPKEIPELLVNVVQHRRELISRHEAEGLETRIAAALPRILALLKAEDDEDFTSYKPGTLIRRITRRMMLFQVDSVEQMIERLQDSQDERTKLVQDFRIGVTRFFRDPESFFALRGLAIEPLLRAEPKRIRVWVPGCSTGEEAYSLAMLIKSEMDRMKIFPDLQVFGTDIDLAALAEARRGSYPRSAFADGLSPFLETYFDAVGDRLNVKDDVRDAVIFSPHNILSDPPFSRIDLISCRNVLIYLNEKGQRTVVPRFHYSLVNSGYLFLGPSESLNAGDDFFLPLSRDHRIFAKNAKQSPGYWGALAGKAEYDRVLETTTMSPRVDLPQNLRPANLPDQSTESQIDQFFLSRLAPPYLVVDAANRVTYVSAALSEFVAPARGHLSSDVDALLQRELRAPVRKLVDALREPNARRDTIEGVVARFGDKNIIVDLEGEVVAFMPDSIMIMIKPVRMESDKSFSRRIQSDETGIIESLEHELALARRHMTASQASFESSEQELRSANEELLSINEEMQSSNEELETSREELQSINEELETINSELRESNRQLVQAHSDLHNIFESTEFATFILGTGSILRRFTKTCKDVCRIEERDIGRPLADLLWTVDYPEFEADIRTVESTLQMIEREVATPKGDKFYQMRMRPYKRLDDKLDGVVITFVDISKVKTSERDLQYAKDRLQSALDSGRLGVLELRAATGDLFVDKAAREILGFPRDGEITFEGVTSLIHDEDRDRVITDIEHALDPASDGIHEISYRYRRFDDEREIWCRVYGTASFRGTPDARLATVVRDITEERHADQREREHAEILEMAYSAAGIAAFQWDAASDKSTWSPNMVKLLGAPDDTEPSFETFDRFIHPEDRDMVNAAVAKSLETQKDGVARFRITRGDRAERILLGRWRVQVQDGKPTGLIGINYDVTDETRAQDKLRLVTAELSHRVKNSLAVIQTVADETLATSASLEEFDEKFTGRLRALAAAHELLTSSPDDFNTIEQLISLISKPYGDRIIASGGKAEISPTVASSLGMVFHELMTNAVKYGALSVRDGKVMVAWAPIPGDNGPMFKIDWREIGGPPAKEPESYGFGLNMIAAALAHSGDGETQLAFRPDGLRAVFTFKGWTDDEKIAIKSASWSWRTNFSSRFRSPERFKTAATWSWARLGGSTQRKKLLQVKPRKLHCWTSICTIRPALSWRGGFWRRGRRLSS